jgi:hypothetical protein
MPLRLQYAPYLRRGTQEPRDPRDLTDPTDPIEIVFLRVLKHVFLPTYIPRDRVFEGLQTCFSTYIKTHREHRGEPRELRELTDPCVLDNSKQYQSTFEG